VWGGWGGGGGGGENFLKILKINFFKKKKLIYLKF